MAVTAKTPRGMGRSMLRRHTVHLRVEGMTCANCQTHVRKALESVDGVKKADVDLETGTADVVVRPGTELPTLTSAVAAAGYTAEEA